MTSDDTSSFASSEDEADVDGEGPESELSPEDQEIEALDETLRQQCMTSLARVPRFSWDEARVIHVSSFAESNPSRWSSRPASPTAPSSLPAAASSASRTLSPFLFVVVAENRLTSAMLGVDFGGLVASPLPSSPSSSSSSSSFTGVPPSPGAAGLLPAERSLGAAPALLAAVSAEDSSPPAHAPVTVLTVPTGAIRPFLVRPHVTIPRDYVNPGMPASGFPSTSPAPLRGPSVGPPTALVPRVPSTSPPPPPPPLLPPTASAPGCLMPASTAVSMGGQPLTTVGPFRTSGSIPTPPPPPPVPQPSPAALQQLIANFLRRATVDQRLARSGSWAVGGASHVAPREARAARALGLLFGRDAVAPGAPLEGRSALAPWLLPAVEVERRARIADEESSRPESIGLRIILATCTSMLVSFADVRAGMVLGAGFDVPSEPLCSDVVGLAAFSLGLAVASPAAARYLRFKDSGSMQTSPAGAERGAGPTTGSTTASMTTASAATSTTPATFAGTTLAPSASMPAPQSASSSSSSSTALLGLVPLRVSVSAPTLSALDSSATSPPTPILSVPTGPTLTIAAPSGRPMSIRNPTSSASRTRTTSDTSALSTDVGLGNARDRSYTSPAITEAGLGSGAADPAKVESLTDDEAFDRLKRLAETHAPRQVLVEVTDAAAAALTAILRRRLVRVLRLARLVAVHQGGGPGKFEAATALGRALDASDFRDRRPAPPVSPAAVELAAILSEQPVWDDEIEAEWRPGLSDNLF